MYKTRAVAGDAYTRFDDSRAYLTHVVCVETGEPLCSRVKPGNLLDDDYATDPQVPATCGTCNSRDPRSKSL